MSPTATTVDTESPPRIGVNRLAKYGLLTVLVATVANALVRMIALNFSTVPDGFVPLSWVSVIGSTVFAAVGATIVYGTVTRFSKRPNRTFTIVAAVVLVLSFSFFIGPPPELAGASTSVVAALAVMHVIVAVISIGILTRMAGKRDDPQEKP